MFAFVVDCTDSAGFRFSVVLQIPTQAGQGDLRWGVNPGTFSFSGGPAAIIASPDVNRGTVMCMGRDSDGKLWMAVEIDKMFAQFVRGADGSYGGLGINWTGSGQTFPDTVVSVTAGAFTWKLSTPGPPTSSSSAAASSSDGS